MSTGYSQTIDLFKKEYWDDRRLHILNIRFNMLKFLQTRNYDSLKLLISSLWSLTSMYHNIEWYIRTRILPFTSFNQLASNFQKLLNETLPLDERLTLRIPGFGFSSLTEILFGFYPEKYPVLNKRTLRGLVILGKINSDNINITSQNYKRFIPIIRSVMYDFINLKKYIEDEIICSRIEPYNFADALLELLYSNRIDKEALIRLEANYKRYYSVKHNIEALLVELIREYKGCTIGDSQHILDTVEMLIRKLDQMDSETRGVYNRLLVKIIDFLNRFREELERKLSQ